MRAAEEGIVVSRRVRAIEYDHVEDEAGVSRRHDFARGVEMRVRADGTILLRHPRKRLWDDFPE
jgi:hypothetical protein